ncbi:MAG: C10 family peptidase [Muribaculaceae bacterium]|nr:C10 family peptidase [Muribaculaceae bacterium]
MRKSLRRLILPALLIGTIGASQASTVSVEDARSIAAEFMNSRGGATIQVATNPIYSAGSSSTPLYYVFNSTDGNAFVIVSAEDTTTPILGYSFECGYATENTPEPMQWMMAGIERELKAAPQLQQSRSLNSRRAMAHNAASQSSAKLLSTANWSQEAPFNNLIPGRPLVGCVGTAMATIMKYHNWPESGTGSYGGVDFNTVYNWNDMRNDNYRSGYTAAEGEAVATLMLHASKSIDTQYGMSGSSAYEVRVPGALSNYFGYDPGVSFKKRADFSTQQAWDNLVKAEIDAGRPVLYCGQDVTAGHAFVCDGYEGEYLHFNWGWGGAANGYFLSTALNPTVSTTHHYNNLNTIIYNIKPADGEITSWSPLHLTADGNQCGLGSDLSELAQGKTFTVRAGNLKNLAYDDFAGKIAVALCASNGAMKALLSNESSLSLPSMATLYNGYIDFRNCALPAGVTAAESDRIRLVTKASGSDNWLPVAGELLTINELNPNNPVPATFNVALPSGVAGVNVTGEPNVIKGWSYNFTAILENPLTDVLTVKANGVVLTPGQNNTYTIENVREDQTITALVQKASDVKEKRSVWVGQPGTLSQVISEEESGTIKDLTIFGTIDARDFQFIRNSMRLNRIDLSGATITAHGSDQANAIPREAFRGLGSLTQAILPKSINRMNNGCFRQTGLTSIVIPANVKTYEYNIFVAASRLRDIYVCRENPEFINWCVLSGVPVASATLHVPSESAKNKYAAAENWKTIGNIIVDPVQATSSCLLAVMDDNRVMFETENTLGESTPNSTVSFKAEYLVDDDRRMDVYANNTLLTPNAEGIYSFNLSGNTMIHFDLVDPIAVDETKSPWKLTDANGSIGMFSDAVNVIPGQEFTVRLNALSIPQYYDQFYWALALTDANGNIKEFISPVNVWSAGAGNNFKLNVNCMVKDSRVREGNQIRVVTSAMKKIWNVVAGAGEEIVDALPAVNNTNPVYNFTIPAIDNATVSGLPASAVRGRDLTLKIVPNSPAHHINLKVNGVEVVKDAATINYDFVAMEDLDFDVQVFDPKEEGSVTYQVYPGELFGKVTPTSIRAHVIVTGNIYSSDLQSAFSQDFAIRTVKTLDLTGVTVIGTDGQPAYTLQHPPFMPANPISTPPTAKVEKIILPDNIEAIDGIFLNCPLITEVVLPKSLRSIPIKPSSAYIYGINNEAFKGCPNLTTIYIPGAPQKDGNGRTIVAHHNPYSTTSSFWFQYYNLGHADPKKVTIVVPEEYLNVYRTKYTDAYFGNPWQAHGYNILSENPVYGVTFNPDRIELTDPDFDVQRAASFLGDNVSVENINVVGKFKPKTTESKCLILDNGEPATIAEDGTITVTFKNPAKSTTLKGSDHELSLIYLNDLSFATTSSLFTVSEPVVTNEANIHKEVYDTSDSTTPVLRDIAENSTVRFGVSFASEHADGMQTRVMLGQQELEADADGLYTVELTNASRTIDIFAVPGEGAVLNAEEIASIPEADAAGITSIGLSGEMTSEQIAAAMAAFCNLESLDLSQLESELPENAFAGMESLENVVLPEMETIPAGTFNGCSSLQSVEIPSSVNNIGEGAFAGCSSLETIRLTGIDEIGDGAFDGCTNLTSVTLLDDAAGNAGNAKPRRAANISNDAFKGVNPNCVIILDQGVSVPQATGNYIATSAGTVTEIQPDGSEVTREGRLYSSASDINFVDRNPIALPHAFTITDGTKVNFNINAHMVETLVIPFDVEKITNSAGTEISIISPAARAESKNVMKLYGADAESNELKGQTSVAANTPYVANMPTAEEFNFSATQGTVPATPAQVKTEGDGFSLHATYSGATMPASEAYLLNEDGSAFVPSGTDEEETEIVPFGVYATSSAHPDRIATGLKLATEISDIEIEEGLRIIRDGDMLNIISEEARELRVYSINGSLITVLSLNKGRNEFKVPAPGLYLVGSTRILF